MYMACFIFLLKSTVSGRIFTRDVQGTLSNLYFDSPIYSEICQVRYGIEILEFLSFLVTCSLNVAIKARIEFFSVIKENSRL